MFKLSVIVPCYNAEQYIIQCLDSLVNQTIGIYNMQIILINDASTDGTLSILEKYRDMYKDNILLINQAINQGQAIGRNIGIDSATGEYIAFLDADDWLELDAYEKLLDVAHKFDVDLVQMNYVQHMEGDNPLFSRYSQEAGLYDMTDPEKKIAFFSKHQLLPIWTGIYKSTIFDNQKIRFANFRKYEDNFLGGIVKFSIGSYYFLNEYLHNYRIIDNSNSHNRNDAEHLVRLEIELEKLKFFSENNMYEKYYNLIRNDFLTGFYCNTIHIIFTRFDYVPLEQIRSMQSIVRQFFPDYMQYYYESGFMFNMILTVPFDFPIEIWEELKNDYLSSILDGDKEKIISWGKNLRYSLEKGN